MKDRTAKVKGAIYELRAVSEDVRMQAVGGFEAALDLFESCIVPSPLAKCSTWMELNALQALFGRPAPGAPVHPQAQCQGRPGAPQEQVEDLGGEGAAGAGPEGAVGGLSGTGGDAGADKDGVAGPWAGGQADLQGDRPAGRYQREGGH